MLTLRFQRVGKTHDTTFRIVAVDSRFSSKSGKAKEILGWWDPRKDKFELKKERIEYWLKNGAQVSDSCYNLLIKAKIIEGKKRPVVIHKKKAEEGEAETPIKAEAPKTEEVKPSLSAQAGEIPAEPTVGAPKVKEEVKEEPKEESKPEKTPSSASTFAKASVDKKATEGREEKKESKEEKSEEKSEAPVLKENTGSK
jgi:small subunit ribosomal protein S16